MRSRASGAHCSASEVLAGALHDDCRAALIGTRSFGKGLIQAVYGLVSDSIVCVASNAALRTRHLVLHVSRLSEAHTSKCYSEYQCLFWAGICKFNNTAVP